MAPGIPSDETVVEPSALRAAASGMGALTSRVREFQRLAGQAVDSVSGVHPWGLLGDFNLRPEFESLARDFEGHLRLMREAMEGAHERLTSTSDSYSAAERTNAEILGSGQVQQGNIRELNPASRFYRDHRLLNGVITSLPYPFGNAGSAAMHTVRLIGDVNSDDKYNISTDVANLAADIMPATLGFASGMSLIRNDPLFFLLGDGLPFLLNSFYWTKWVVDWVTGDPIATGQAAYNFDSLAEGCHRLAGDVGAAVETSSRDVRWQGEAADAARRRLATFRKGIDDTGHSADGVSAMLQLASSLMGAVEGFVINTVNGVIAWAVRVWFDAQLVATIGGPVGGATAEAGALTRIAQASGLAATRVRRAIATAETLLVKIAAQFRRLGSTLRRVERRAFTALRESSVGQKHLVHPYGTVFSMNRVRTYAGLHGKHSRTEPRHLWTGIWKDIPRRERNARLNEVGLFLNYKRKDGTDYPNFNPKVTPMRYYFADGNRYRQFTDYSSPVTNTARNLLPFGRAIQYEQRSIGAFQTESIDNELDLW